MHVWIVEVKVSKDSKWSAWSIGNSRELARLDSKYWGEKYYSSRVVKYISTKGE